MEAIMFHDLKLIVSFAVFVIELSRTLYTDSINFLGGIPLVKEKEDYE